MPNAASALAGIAQAAIVLITHRPAVRTNALGQHAMLVTNNTREFAKGTVCNWIVGSQPLDLYAR